MSDELQRFVFQQVDTRGVLVRLEQSYVQVLAHHNYPPAVARLIGEFMAAAALLSATLKIDGQLCLQARGNGQIPLIMAEATSDRTLRAIARGADEADSEHFAELLHEGQLCITIEPRQGKRYQGIVSLEGDNLARCLEQYFLQSEQLATRLWLHSDSRCAAGLMLQELPAPLDASRREQHLRDWEHLGVLTDTLTSEELLALPFQTLLQRLYHQDNCQVYAAESLQFRCSCSRERTGNALISLGQAELQQLIQEQGQIDVNCEFCHQHYHFSAEQILGMLHHTLH